MDVSIVFFLLSQTHCLAKCMLETCTLGRATVVSPLHFFRLILTQEIFKFIAFITFEFEF